MLLSILFILCICIKSSFENNSIVFKSGEDGYFCIRIPSLLITAKGTLLAFGEGRLYSCSDYTEMDIVYKRSLDNGKTWSNLQILYRGNASNDDDYNRVGAIAPVQLKYNRRILVPFCKNNLIVMQTYSDDDGLTFFPPQVIPNVMNSKWKWVALGPPSGLLLQSNRILIPAYYSVHPKDDGLLSTGYVMLNDFNGQIDKWYLGGEIKHEIYFPNECQAVELLPNTNSIFINARSLDVKRIGAYSNDGGLTFNKINVLNTLVQPLTGCEGSTIYYPNTHQLFYTGLADISSTRKNLSLYISDDNGENWKFIKTIFQGPSAYSSLTILNDQSIGLLYEWANQTDVIFRPGYISFTIVYNATKTKFF